MGSRSLADLAEKLEPAGFARIHRATIVNLARVREFRTADHREFRVILETGERLRLSRTYRHEVAGSHGRCCRNRVVSHELRVARALPRPAAPT